MVRKRESVAEREARERMRDRYDFEVKAVVEFFGYAGQIDQLNAKIDVLVERQGETVARLAESTDVNRAADTVCWPVDGPLIGPGGRRSSIASAGEWWIRYSPSTWE